LQQLAKIRQCPYGRLFDRDLKTPIPRYID
jgi:hypothetical protein